MFGGFNGHGGSWFGYQESGNHGGGNQHSGQGTQQEGNQIGFQSNPKQLNSGQCHIFSTSTCKQDSKLKKHVQLD